MPQYHDAIIASRRAALAFANPLGRSPKLTPDTRIQITELSWVPRLDPSADLVLQVDRVIPTTWGSFRTVNSDNLDQEELAEIEAVLLDHGVFEAAGVPQPDGCSNDAPTTKRQNTRMPRNTPVDPSKRHPTLEQFLVLREAALHGDCVSSTRPDQWSGGGRRRMIERMAEYGWVEPKTPWRLTPLGIDVLRAGERRRKLRPAQIHYQTGNPPPPSGADAESRLEHTGGPC